MPLWNQCVVVDLPILRLYYFNASMDTDKSFNFDQNTYKYYYSPLSPQEKSDNIVINNNTCDGGQRKSQSQSIEHFFEAQPQIKKRKLLSSTVARATRDGVSYISTNSDDGD
ncbi:uncharacterized protein LOC123669018 [Melitaea cinxia]|uniref:uncharacterized protein LOC123669018 n=1 Tax=Melitaea cinxia TaxID=113334 RepID=UPI001E2711A0|nr:uncharacterized protein LOC123669018 [Melitaea cinxia]